MNINYLVWPRAGPGGYRVYSKIVLFSCQVTDIICYIIILQFSYIGIIHSLHISLFLLLWCLSCSSVKLGYGLSLDRGSSLLHRTRRGKNMNHGGSVSRTSAAWLLLRAAWCSLQTPGKTIFLMFQSQIGGWSVIMPDHDTAAPLSSIIILLFLLTADCGSARPSAAASDQSIIVCEADLYILMLSVS